MGQKKRVSDIYSGVLPEQSSGFRKILTSVLYRKVEFDQEGIAHLRECTQQGCVIFSSYESSQLSLSVLLKELERHQLPRPVFALDYNPVLVQSFSYLAKRVVQAFRSFFLREKYAYVLDTDYIEQKINERKSVLFSLSAPQFFLRRYLERKYDTILYFIELQKKVDLPLFIVPEILFWNRNPERSKRFFSIKPTGNKSILFSLISVISTPSYIKILKPVNLKEEITQNPSLSSQDLAVAIRKKLIDNYQHEKRLILGPVLKSKQEMMEKVLYHPNVLQAVTSMAGEGSTSERKLRKKAYKYYKEIAADFSIRWAKFFSTVLGYLLSKIFSGLKLDRESLSLIRDAAQKGPLIYTPSHKSHMDSMILAYMFFQNKLTPPHIAAGVNMAFFPLGSLFRRSGAFFLRRSFKGLKLYPVVFKQYVKTLIQEGYPIKVFIEGGRTRTGRLRNPKVGFLNFLIEAIDEGYNQDLVFVPISITYDRVLEESSYEREMRGKSKNKESVGSVVKSRSLLKRNHGHVYIDIDVPFTLKEVEAAGCDHDARSLEVAGRIIKGINRVTTVNPGALVTTAILLMSGKGFSRNALLELVDELHDYLLFSSAHLAEESRAKEAIGPQLDRILKMYLDDHIIDEVRFDEENKVEGMYVIHENNRLRMTFYKNSIQHFLAGISFISLGILYHTRKNQQLTFEDLKESISFLKQLCMTEFMYTDFFEESDQATQHIVREYLALRDIITIDNEVITGNEVKRAELLSFSRIVQDILESYYIVLTSLVRLKSNAVSEKDLVLEVRKTGATLYHTNVVQFAEALSMPNYQNAIKHFAELGCIAREEKSRKQVVLRKKNSELLQYYYDTLTGYLEALQ